MRERNKIKSLHEVDDNGRFLIKNRLGQFLLDAARLYEGMSNYRDKKLLREYISKDPPLHPRRTLDQAYHWTLNSTWERDRDQVVYRHTTTEPDKFHKYDPGTKTWQEHEDFHIKGTCEECKRNIQKLSRVIMVDQLWMWVLDAKTIITCFPKRYGSNKQDSSAVHKSIRVRIQEIGHDQIRTAFDLGLIIIDECINTLFNRARTTSRQPQVIDAFSKAIGNIMHKQTVAFERLWRWADNASDIYKSNGNGDASELHVTLLDIHPEGQLEREIKDIVEELDIMIHITKVHEKMLLAFTSSAENLLDPFGKFGENKKREMISNTSRGKTNKIAQSLAEYKEEGESLAKHEKEGEVPADEKSEKSAFEKRRDDYNWFKLNADELLETIKGRIDELEELRKIAGRTADSVKDLLELKQQQASVVQAWQAVRQSNETIKQSQSIMMFTLVTIIFVS
ncbi:hypothetical protein GL218_08506 [Daldinia childiae]|uniref:uncharacterized protein n=1 Tax=Daldinia childiae TaxID=326645 RepID=UPI0014450FCF|nr:uncharacterized protein GL218_08506 [Daldinia childiae]KAF3067199.1 hypothetical protein GL218_08506 [Daldinia childiae]